jgi:hypothetical protein
MTKATRLLFISLLLSLFPIAVSAQSSSGVTGVVTDTSGAVISGATVTLTDTKTSKELTTTTNDQGVYQFVQVPPGQGYTLSFTGPGFQTLQLTDVALGVGITETHNAELKTGGVTETVVVTDQGGATLNTTDATIGNVIDERRLRELPIAIRNSAAALIGLQAGVVGGNVGAGGGNRAGSVTGSRADQGNITIDGIDANDQATGQAFSTVGNAPIDSIQEFRAVTTNPNSSEGRSSGGQVEMVTKSGTNEFHGNLREYNRTAKTAANSFFNNRAGIARPQLTRNQFGGSIGGPILKDKLFFFFDYEGRRDAQGVSYLRIVPLPAFRNGSVSFLNNTAGCATNARLNTAPQCITTLTPAQVAALDPRGIGANAALLAFINARYPLPNDLTAGNGVNTGGFRFNAPSQRKDNTYVTRIDWNATNNQRVFGRFNIARRQQTDTVNTVAQQFPGDPESGTIVVKDYSWVVGHNWVLNSNVVNQFTAGVSRSGLIFDSPFAPSFPNELTFGAGLSNPFAGIDTQDRFVLTPTIRDDLTWTKGKHNISLGGQFKPIDSKSGLVNDFNFVTVGLGGLTNSLNASLRPGTIGTGATRAAAFDAAFAFLLGRIGSVQTNFVYDTQGVASAPGSGKTRDYKYNEYEFYIQDNWRVRSDLTITAGMRYHYYSPPYEANGFQAGNDIDFQNLLDIRTRNAALGISGDTAEPFLRYDLIGKGNNARALYQPDLNNFAPRLSFAYNPSFTSGVMGKIFGDKKTVLRGGGSVQYDRIAGAVTFIQDQVSYLFDNTATRNFGATSANTALLNDPRFGGITTGIPQNVAPVVTRPVTPFVDAGFPFGNIDGATNFAVDQNFKIPYSIQYSFGIQRELPGDIIFDVSYVGRQGRQLFSQADAAQILDFRDNASGQTLIPAFNNLQSQLLAGRTGAQITPVQFFENQINAASLANYGGTCVQVFGVNCTRVIAANFAALVNIGDLADTVQALFANGLLNTNVGLSSQFSTNAYITNLASSSYNGMLLSVRKRFSKGFQADFNYTLSHSIDNQSSVANTVFGGLICDVRDLRVCRGNSDFDIRHLFNMNFVWELPFGKGRAFGGDAPGWLNTIIGDWTVTGIGTARSGLPFSLTTSSFPVGFVFNSPAVITGDRGALQENIADTPTGTIQFFTDPTQVFSATNPLAGVVRNPNGGEIGNRNALRGAGFWNVDLAVLKNFRLPWSENQRIQIRWEMYNAFNHNSFGLPNANINSTTFGQVTTSASAPREMQFAFRFEF